MTAKVCPRCGCQYENFKSTTCPQCFAILVAVDDATAEELSAARAEVERSAEFQETKAADDERFRQQSFGACLGVAGLTLLTLIIAVVLLVSAAHRRTAVNRAPNAPIVQTETKREDPLTTLPVAAATLPEVLPSNLAPYTRQTIDANMVLTGTLTPLFHGVYLTPTRKTLDVYALPAGRPTSEQNEFRLGVTLASQVGGNTRPVLFFSTEYWHFAVLASPGDTPAPAEFRDALAAHFGYTKRS